jgi:hypothetical protein
MTKMYIESSNGPFARARNTRDFIGHGFLRAWLLPRLFRQTARTRQGFATTVLVHVSYDLLSEFSCFLARSLALLSSTLVWLLRLSYNCSCLDCGAAKPLSRVVYSCGSVKHFIHQGDILKLLEALSTGRNVSIETVVLNQKAWCQYRDWMDVRLAWSLRISSSPIGLEDGDFISRS